MARSQPHAKRAHPQSNITRARARVTLEALLRSTRKPEEGRLWVARDERGKELDDDPLGPAKGIINGALLSLILWDFIARVVLWVTR